MRPTAVVLALLLVGTACTTQGPVGDSVRGPLPTRVQHPLALTELALRPRRPVAQPRGSAGAALQASYSSIFTSNGDEGANFAFDGETARAAVRLRYGLGAGLDLEAELAASSSSGGFLDDLVQGFHELLNLPDPGRENAPNHAHDMVIRGQGEELWSQDAGLVGLGDVPLVLTWTGGAAGDAASERWRYGLRGAVELPTGDQQQGFGNGGLDWGVGWLAERSHGRWTQHLGGWWARVAQPAQLESAGIGLDDAWQLDYALELRAFRNVSWIAQLGLRAPLVTDLDLEGLREPILDLALGAIGDAGNDLRWFAAFHEDLISRAGPDFSLSAGLSWNL